MYDYNKWRERLRNRTDMSTYLTHLTKAFHGSYKGFPKSPVEVLIKILNEQKIKASSEGFINGGVPVVCFQDAPLHGVSQNVKHERIHKVELGNTTRYEPIGLSLPKDFVFHEGGRPVIYEKPEIREGRRNYNHIDKELLWRVVSLDLTDNSRIIDWTHEREWRVKGDIEFDLSMVYIILADAIMYKEFISQVDKKIIKKVRGITVLESILY